MAARNIIYWDRIKTLRDSIAVVVATAGGAGLFPKAPGTMGTIVALPLALAIREWSVPLRLAVWIGLTIAGTWAAKVFDELMQTGDNQCIVIDEVVGLGITSWTLTHVERGPAWLAAFVLFRIFDIIKIFPVRLVDDWSKKKAKENTPLARWWGGFGVMADDIMAGVQGLIVMIILQRLNVFPS
jgi:phosphatidylglycerophosphatase A